MHRRTLIAGSASLVATSLVRAQSTNDVFTEYQRGDSDAEYETVIIDPQKIEQIVRPPNRATFEPKAPHFGSLLVASASKLVGISRDDNPDGVKEFLSLFDLPYRYDSGTLVPFCAAGIAFAAGLAYSNFLKNNVNQFNRVSVAKQTLDDLDHWYFYPSPSVWSMYFVSAGKGSWRSGSLKTVNPQPGWIVIYDFGKGADHCGIVETVDADALNTIEFNTTIKHGSETNGGVVTKKHRKYNSTIKGFIRIA